MVLRVFGDRALVRSGDDLATYRPKGALRHEGLLAGDRVTLEGEHITSVLPRQNKLGRPPVANVRILLAVASVVDPAMSNGDCDRILLQAEAAGLEPLLVLNKADITPSQELDRYAEPYRRAGYPVIYTSATKETGLLALRQGLPVGLAAMAGPSGVGKSSLLRGLSDYDVAVAAVSPRLRRGRHTTRASTVFDLGEGKLLADTPGFSALELPEVEPRELSSLYPEMRRYSCRFADCLHRTEPDCAVQSALERGEIEGERYRRYLQFLHELEGRPKRWH